MEQVNSKDIKVKYMYDFDEEDINKWLHSRNITIIDIKFQDINRMNYRHAPAVLIIYKDNE